MVKEGNAVWRKSSRKDCLISVKEQYQKVIRLHFVDYRLLQRLLIIGRFVILIPNKKQTIQKEHDIIVKGDDYGKEI